MSDRGPGRFARPYRLSTRRCAGPDLELVVSVGANGLEVSVWDPATGGVTPVPGLPGHVVCPVLSADGRSVLTVRDDSGAELGHLWSFPVDGGPGRDLTPDLPDYTLRGIGVSGTGTVVFAPVSADGFGLWAIPAGGEPHCLHQTRNEAWNSLVSADGAWASLDTTDHNPGVRRFAVTIVDSSGDVAAVLTDGPEAPVRAIRFSPAAGDERLLVSTERTGFARPAVWNPLSGDRIEVDAPGLVGDVVPLDWSDDTTKLLVAHVDRGIHQLYEYDLDSQELLPVEHPDGAYFQPDVASALTYVWASHYGPGGQRRLLRQRWDLPLDVLDSTLVPEPVVEGTRLRSAEIRSADGTVSQLWVAGPAAADRPVPLILDVHGGPNWATVDGYDPTAQAWLDEGFGFASLNYRGSVTFGREFRESFWGKVGDGELEDLAAARNWLVDQGIASEVFITGASYGGFLTLLSLGRRPDLFSGGLAFVALADWRISYGEMNPALQAAWRAFLGGTPESDPERLARSSPLTYVEQVRAPVLLSQGTRDTRTPPRQAAEYARRLRAAGGDVVLEWFDGGHGLAGTDALRATHERCVELVRRALRGERWSRP